MIRKFLTNYAARHRHPANVWLHVLGLPVTFVLPVVLLSQDMFLWSVASFLIGYGLQFIGHAIEGNDPGEVVLVKRAFGLPFIDIVPPRNESTCDG